MPVQIASGTYEGDGTEDRDVPEADLGFTPTIVIIHWNPSSNTLFGYACMKINGSAGQRTFELMPQTSHKWQSDRVEISGERFYVSGSDHPNKSGESYIYICIGE